MVLSLSLVASVMGQKQIANQVDVRNINQKETTMKKAEKVLPGKSFTGVQRIEGDATKTAITGGYSTSFEGDFPPEGWTIINNDGGAKTWIKEAASPNTGVSHASVSYEAPNDDWLVSPQIEVAENGSVQFMAKSRSTTFLESFNVKVSKTTTDVSAFTITLEEVVGTPAEYTMYSYTLTDHAEISAGDQVYVAIQCVSNDRFNLYVDDFIVPGANEAGISLTAPIGDLNEGAANVKVNLINGGTSDLTSATIQWEFNNVAQPQVDWTGALISGALEEVAVGTPDFVAGANTLKIWVENPNGEVDGINHNDTIYAEITANILGQLNEKFEGGDFPPYGWSTSNPSLDYSWSLMDDSDWGGYGFTLENNYAGLLSNANGAIDTLYTPQLTLDGTITELSFLTGGLSHTTTNGGGTLHVIYSADKVTWTEAGSIDFTAGEDVASHTIDLSSIANGDYYFAFVLTNTYNNEDYINITGIDNVKGPLVAGLLDNDIRIAGVNYPKTFVNAGEETTIQVKIQNTGLVNVNNAEVTLTIDGTTTLTANTSELQYGQSEIVEFTWTAVIGRHSFEATVAADDNNDNNTAIIEGIVTEEGLLTAGFEDGTLPLGWMLDTEGNWKVWLNGFTEHYEGANGMAAGNINGFENAILRTRKVILTGTEELNFYATVGNASVGAYSLDIVVSTDGENWTEVQTGIIPTEFMELYTIDLSGVTAGEYFIGFRASGSGDGTYATWIAIDHIVGPEVTPLYAVNFTITDDESTAVENATILFNGTELTSDANGLASIEGLNAGEYNYSVEAYGFENYSGSVTITDADVDEAIELIPISAFNVTFNVTESWGSNSGVEGAAISFTNGTETWTGTTDANGTVTIADVLIHNGYTYSVTASGLAEEVGTFDVVDQDVPLNIAMDEVIVNPFGLNIEVTDNQAILTWNPEGAAGFSDGFEDQTFDAWGELIEGNGTGGDAEQDKPYWAVESPDGGPDTNPEGSFVAHCDWGYTIDTWLITPSITVTDGMTVTFNWNKSYYWSVSPSNNDDLAVKVSTDGGSTWETIWTEEEHGEFENFTWIETTIDLSDYAGAAVFAFNIVGNDNAANEMDMITFSNAKRPIGSRVISDAAQVAKDAKTDGGYKYTFINSARTKAFQSYTVTLDGVDVATELTEKTYTFSDLAVGSYTAGVKSVYESGASELVTIDFDIAEPTFALNFTVKDQNDANVEGVTITIEGIYTVLTTDANGNASIELEAGTYNYTTTKEDWEDATGSVTITDAAVNEVVTMQEVGIAGLTLTNLAVYPNPTNGLINVEANGEFNVTVINSVGQVVYNSTMVNNTVVNLNDVSSGLYVIMIKSDKQYATKNIIVE